MNEVTLSLEMQRKAQIVEVIQTASIRARHGNHRDPQLVHFQGTKLSIQEIGSLREAGQRAKDSAPTSKTPGNCRRLLNKGTKTYSELLRRKADLVKRIDVLKATENYAEGEYCKKQDLQRMRNQLQIVKNSLLVLNQNNLEAIPWQLRDSIAFERISPEQLAGYTLLLQQDSDHNLER